jgi:D-lyxose ketol-isomerase
VAGTSAATAPTAAAAPSAPTTTLSPEERFGRRKDPNEEKAGQLTELTASVAALSAKPRGELVITLDNGQVWAEIAPGSKIRLKPGDSVTIEAGTLGSFILIAPNKRSSKVSRVR